MKTSFRNGYGGTEILEIRELPIPKPKENELLIKVKASTVNRTDEGVLLGKPFVFRFLLAFLSRVLRLRALICQAWW